MTQNAERSPAVVIAVATFKRPSQLSMLLPELVKQAAELPDVKVVVADNDPLATARTVVTAIPSAHYVHEPSPGLAAVRNRLLHEAGDADAVVFIDDDEHPAPGWLTSLVDLWQRTGCTAISGPVRSDFEKPPASLVMGTGVFDRVRRPTGTSLKGAATNNLLLDLGWLRAHGLEFDPEFGETGGEDTMLTHSIVAAGGTIVWCDAAEVTETVPANRVRLRWVVRRLIRTSNSWARVEIKVGRANGAHRKILATTAALIPYLAVRGIVRGLVGVITKDVQRVAFGLRDACNAAGVGLALLGRDRAEYRRISGT